MKNGRAKTAKFNHDLLRAKRVEKGYSKTEVARRLGVSYQSVWNWESGRLFPVFSTLIPYCELLEIDPKELAPTKKRAA